MSSQNLHIQRATYEDAALIAALGARTFEAAFGPDNQPEDMAQYLALNFSPSRIEAELANPGSTFLLASETGQAVGYAMLRAGDSPACVEGANPVELVRIYVEQNTIGQGYGSALMKACLSEAKSAGYQTIWLGVWKRNQRAIEFYEQWGFVKVGTQKFVLGRDVQNDYLMERSLELTA